MTPEQAERKRQEARKGRNSDACRSCGGGFYTPSGLVPHAKDCPRVLRRRGQSIAEQDAERRELADGGPRYGPIRWPEGPSALSDYVKQRPSWSRKPKP